MKVYIPIDISGIYANNPFTTELVRGLQDAGVDVTTGLFRLGQNSYHPDIIHFQWPERIFPTTRTAGDLNWLEERLNQFRKHAKIVVTIHNDVPHKKKWSEYENLFKLIYRYADGFVHMGDRSEKLLCKRFPEETSNKQHVYIPHGNYVVFGKQVGKSYARQRLKIPDQERKKIAIIVGSIRKVDELRRIRLTAGIVSQLNGKVIFAGSVSLEKPPFIPGRTATKRLFSELKQVMYELRLKNTRGLIFHSGHILHSMMAEYLSAADIIVIPRGRVLNSGNLALGFTYGLVVVGPDSGNVGEILKKHGNPTFNPDMDKVSMKSAINNAFALADQGIGKSNKEIALSEWSWEKIGKQHLAFYRKLTTYD